MQANGEVNKKQVHVAEFQLFKRHFQELLHFIGAVTNKWQLDKWSQLSSYSAYWLFRPWLIADLFWFSYLWNQIEYMANLLWWWWTIPRAWLSWTESIRLERHQWVLRSHNRRQCQNYGIRILERYWWLSSEFHLIQTKNKRNSQRQ